MGKIDVSQRRREALKMPKDEENKNGWKKPDRVREQSETYDVFERVERGQAGACHDLCRL